MEQITGTIKAVSIKNKANGQIGFLIEEDKNWFNISAEKDELTDLLEIIKKDNKVSFESNNQIAKNITLVEKSKENNLNNFESLLNDAHSKFKHFNIKTELISMDYEKKQALFSACLSIESSDGVTLFMGHGDAEGITSSLIKPHFIRMAESRAIVRALKLATNNAKVSEEETTQ